MAWTAPRTWVAGEIVTAAIMNAHVRDNLLAVERVLAKKTTTKTITNSTAEADLLNYEFSVGAGLMGATGIVRVTAWGDWLNNSGAPRDFPRIRIYLGSTPVNVLDWSQPSAGVGSTASATRFGWRCVLVIANAGAPNSQFITQDFFATGLFAAASAGQTFTVGEGRANSTNGGVVTAVGVGTGACDTTAAMPVQLTATNTDATATHETRLFGAVMELLQ